MARGGGPPNHWRITGTPSLSEVPSGGARAFCLLLRFSKVSRCQSGTLSSRYRSNGYVHNPTVVECQAAFASKPAPTVGSLECQVAGRRLSGRYRRQASSHIWIVVCQAHLRRLVGRHGSKLPRHRFSVAAKLCRHLCVSQAAPTFFGPDHSVSAGNRTGPGTSAGACNDHIRVVGRMNSRGASGGYLTHPKPPLFSPNETFSITLLSGHRPIQL